MKFQSLSSYVLAFLAALFLAACGGGGAANNPDLGGDVIIRPSAATVYAGQPVTFTLSGGRAPYSVTSSDSGILPVPSIVDGHSFSVVPNNPGVIDTGLQPTDLPVRTVIISIRDTTGVVATSSVKVARNFLTGYGLSIGPSTCASAAPCRGGETALIFDTTTNGSLNGNKTFRFDRLRGPFQFLDKATGVLSDSITITADHEGKITVFIRATAGTVSEVSDIRVTDIASGASVERIFVISSLAATAQITLVPTSLNFVGATQTQCGVGTSDVLVFDGLPPYAAFAAKPGILIEAVTNSGNPARFRVTAGDTVNCFDKEPVIFQDSTGARATLEITTTKGPAPPAPPAMTVSPTSIDLPCGGTGSITVVGGSGSYAATSTSPRVTAIVSGNSVAISRAASDAGFGTAFPNPSTVTITDGAKTQDVTVKIINATAAGTCP